MCLFLITTQAIAAASVHALNLSRHLSLRLAKPLARRGLGRPVTIIDYHGGMRFVLFFITTLAIAADFTTSLGDAYPYTVSAIATDASGNTYVVGSRKIEVGGTFAILSSGTFITAAPPVGSVPSGSDVFVSKLDPNGQLLFTDTFGGKGTPQDVCQGTCQIITLNAQNPANFTVLYGGAAPGFVAGVTQFNVHLGTTGSQSEIGVNLEIFGPATITQTVWMKP